MDAILDIKRRFQLAGEEANNENLATLFNCGLFDVWKDAYTEFASALGRAMCDDDRSASGSDDVTDGKDSEDDFVDEGFQQWER
mmetsp:Transcript_24908/g.48508  ORF Transcript_24908/g.48508 Transcript_24908/m.48508 type:complete len:84 (-) Transcript_24908:25-276(-)